VEENVSSGSAYAALSHCWGSAKFLTLCRDNAAQFRSRIPAEALSQTIRDSIRTARELGLPYIWIDTLCIVQDDDLDWNREAALMASVYGGADITIAASAANDGNGGLKFERSSKQKCLVDLFLERDAHSSGQLGPQPSRQPHVFVPQSFQSACLSWMPLLKRGWVLQERLLSRRTLHWTSTEVFWECNQICASETFPAGLPLELVPSRAKESPTLSMWSWIVKEYSACQLSYAKDRLIAISAVVRRIQQQTGDQYVAGMWRVELEKQLTWRTHSARADRQLVDTATYVAPTWSWASAGVAIEPSPCASQLKHDFSDYISVLDVEIGLAGSDPLGALLESRLTIGCPTLLCVTLNWHPFADYYYLSLDGDELPGTVWPDFAFHDVEIEAREVIALPTNQRQSDDLVLGLLLEHTGRKKGVYRRVGMFVVPNFRKGKAFVEMVEGKQNYAVRSDDYCKMRTMDTGDVRYIVNLI
jgi:hypothetical protein